MRLQQHTRRPLGGRRARRVRAAAACALVTGGCSAADDGCKGDLRVALSPSGPQQLAIGERATARVALAGCGGDRPLEDTFTWVARDTAVVRVDAGVVTGRAPGATVVEARGARYGPVAEFAVTVR